MDNQKIIGIDIGATKTHIGLVQDEKIVKENKIPTSSQAPQQQIIDELIAGIEQLNEPSVSGIGIGVPGLVDEEKGIIYDLWNIPSWQEVFLKKQLEEHFQKPVHITNDANTFVLGEKTFGRGKAFRNIVGLTLGSGFGTGIIIDHKLYSGSFSSAGELADIPYLDKTIESYCSGKFFKEFGMEGAELHGLAKEGDAKALEIYAQYGRHLGDVVNIVLSILSPQAIFLGGSISGSFPFFKEALEERIKAFPFKRVSSQLSLEPSELTNAAVLGAAALIKMRESLNSAQ